MQRRWSQGRASRSLVALLTLLALSACPSEAPAEEPDADDGSGANADVDAGPAAPDEVSGAEGEGEGDAPTSDAGPAVEDLGAVRFIAIGDSGKGNEGQYLVAAAMKAVCEERGGCDFAVMLGDNIYNSGVDDIDDAQWQEKFELPYAELDFPFYSTLGNHDYGAPPLFSWLGGIGIDPRRGEVQVEYTGHSQKFVMPDSHYRVVEGPVELVSINTTSLFWADSSTIADLLTFDDENDRQTQNLATWAAESTSPWRIAFGHHPYLSNGPHGNAGVYDNVIIEDFIGSGSTIKYFLEDHVLGQFDVYLCGHDHSLQDVGHADGTELIVSGGGASHTDLGGENPVEWQADRRGFVVVEADETQMKFTFVVVPDAEDGVPDPWYYGHERTITQ